MEEMKSLFGILIGDCSGSPYEGRQVTGDRIGPYTDDTEQAYGIALWLKSGKHTRASLKRYLQMVYSGVDRGYGANQAKFLEGRPHRTDSFGNGSAMRAAPIGEYCKKPETVIKLAALQSQLTHNHPQAIAGSVTIALLAYLAKSSRNPRSINTLYPRALLPETGKKYVCSLEASQSVPPAVEAFQSGKSFEDVLRKALAYGGDTDTIAAMACGLAALRFGIPAKTLEKVAKAHPGNAEMARKIKKLSRRFNLSL